MNLDKFKKGIEDIKMVKMTHREKDYLKSNIDLYIKNSLVERGVRSPYFSYFSTHTKLFGALFSMIVIFLAGSNAYFFAEKSLPGETLYPFKVDVIEPLQYSLATDSLSKANIEAYNLDKRLREAEILEVQGKLSDTVLNDLTTRINSHVNSFDNLLNNIYAPNTADDSDVKIDFDAKINAHSKIIDSLGRSTDENSNIKRIKDLIENKVMEKQYGINVSSQMKTSNFSSNTDLPTEDSSLKERFSSTTEEDLVFAKKKKNIENIINRTKENVQKIKKTNKANKQIIKDAEDSINIAEEALKNAEIESISGNKARAYQGLIDSRRKVKEASTVFEISQELDGGVK